MGPLSAISIPFMQAVPHKPVIDYDSCIHFKTSECKVCEKVCESKAIDHGQQDRIEEIDVGAVILATGFKSFDARKIPEYGYGKFQNVVTGMEFEKMNNASGPTGGKIQMADGRPPKSVGIIHCVGSRDERHRKYCSRVCCMYALKFAHLIKEKTEAEVYNFYIDMRCFGKGYEEFYHRLLEEEVRFIRGRAASVSDFALDEKEKGKLIVRVEDTLIGQVRRIPVDMVVLATGLEPGEDAQKLARTFHISCGDGFFTERHPKLAPVSTPTDGIYIAGACQGPKDIPDTVAQASAAASQVQVLMSKGEIEVESATSVVDGEICAGCRICNTLCSLSAISFDEEKHISVINDVLCKGCGTCAAACPSAAITARHFTDEQLFAEIEGALYDLVPT
jgi:heterodisulfide reductase subunit A